MSTQFGTALLVPIFTAANTVAMVIILVPASLSFPSVLTITVAGNSLGKGLTNAESESSTKNKNRHF